jgi:hypothetical protein
MSVRRTSDSEALAVAASVNFPDLPSSGTHVVYENKYYLLAIRDGIYVAWDISVYSPGGDLVTGPASVYATAVKEALSESGETLAEIGKGLFWLAAIWGAVWLYSKWPRRAAERN